MVTTFGIFCTDEVAKNGTRFPVPCLEEMIWEGSDGRPSNLNHDFHRPVAWSVSSGLYISHERSYVVGNFFLPESDEEYKLLNKKRLGFFYSYQKEFINKYKDPFFEVLAQYGISNNDAVLVYNGILMYLDKDVVDQAFQELAEIMDGDFLIKLEDLLKYFDYMGQGVFKHKKSYLAVVIHPYLRRSFSILNNFNFEFLNLLWKVYESGNKSVKILLDLNCLGYAPSFITSHEYDYWYGPTYSDDIESIPPDLTKYVTSETDHLFTNISQTEFIWQKKKDNQYQFEMEELVDQPSPTLPKDSFGCRYLHALYDLESKEFNHFDGAIRIYDFEQMCDRTDVAMNKAGHRAEYQKLFRIDGHIPLNLWKSLITQYLIANPNVYEYFGIERPYPELEKLKTDAKQRSLQDLVPVILNRGDGVRILFSYQDFDYKVSSERSFIVLDEITTEDNAKYGSMELATIEVYKALNEVGADIELPKEGVICHCTDNYNVIPMIYHGAESAEEDLNKTLEGIRHLIVRLAKNGSNQRYSFCLSWKMKDSFKRACLSFMGHVEDLDKWMCSFKNIPADREGMKIWLNEQNNFVHNNGNDSLPPNGSFLKSDGILYFKRHNILNDVKILESERNEEGNLKITFGTSDKFIATLMQNGDIDYSQEWILHELEEVKTDKMEIENEMYFNLNGSIFLCKKILLNAYIWSLPN